MNPELIERLRQADPARYQTAGLTEAEQLGKDRLLLAKVLGEVEAQAQAVSWRVGRSARLWVVAASAGLLGVVCVIAAFAATLGGWRLTQFTASALAELSWLLLPLITSFVTVIFEVLVVERQMQADSVRKSLAGRLVSVAAKRTPLSYRDDLRSEWFGEINAMQRRPVTAIIFALSVLVHAKHVARALEGIDGVRLPRAPEQIDNVPTVAVDLPAGQVRATVSRVIIRRWPLGEAAEAQIPPFAQSVGSYPVPGEG